MNATSRMPVLFVGHGSPMAAFEDNRFTQAWTQLGEALPTPRAIVCVSAHWYTRGTGVTAMAQPKTIHDFYGFPEALYQYHYRAPGDPTLAQQIMELLQPTEVIADVNWGYDHGSWTVLKHLYPHAQIPVLQLSIDGTQSNEWHYQLGQRLKPLRDQGVLIMGSGNVVHNLRYLQRSENALAHPLAQQFNDYVRTALRQGDDAALIDYAAQGAAASFAVPTPDHYLPLLYVLGAREPSESMQLVLDEVALASVSMLSVSFGMDISSLTQLRRAGLEQ